MPWAEIIGSVLTGLFILELLTETPSDVIKSIFGADTKALKKENKALRARVTELENQLQQRDVSGIIAEQHKLLAAQNERLKTLEAIATGDPTVGLPKLRGKD